MLSRLAPKGQDPAKAPERTQGRSQETQHSSGHCHQLPPCPWASHSTCCLEHALWNSVFPFIKWERFGPELSPSDSSPSFLENSSSGEGLGAH